VTTTYDTPHGRAEIHDDGHVIVTATNYQLVEWANRPGERWPGSDLAVLDSITATFDSRGDLVDLEQSPGPAELDEYGVNMTADEFNAWSSDVLIATGDERAKAAVR
jgi:hypothetical protein